MRQRQKLCSWGFALGIFAAGPVLAKPFQPDPTDVCSSSPAGQSLNSDLVVLRLFASDKITDAMLDITAGPITAQNRADAISDRDYCDHDGKQCDKKAKPLLHASADHLKQFLDRARSGHDDNFEIHDNGSIDANETVVHEFLIAHHYVGTCRTIVKSVDTSDVSKGKTSVQAGFVLRSQIDDLRFDRNAAQYKGLDAAKLGYDADHEGGTSKYSAQLTLGYRAARIQRNGSSDYLDIIPFISYSEKRTASDPPPKKPGTNEESAGLMFDVRTAFAGGNSILFYPKYTKSRQDGSEVVSLNAHWNPQMRWLGWQVPQEFQNLLYWSLEPDFNVAESHVTQRGTNQDFVSENSFFRYGPEVNLRLFGYPGSVVEKLNFSTSYKYFEVSNGPIQSMKNLKISLNYSPALGDSDSAPTASFSLTYSRGKDLDTFLDLRELVLGVGVKF